MPHALTILVSSPPHNPDLNPPAITNQERLLTGFM
jgi:hypothetical protein